MKKVIVNGIAAIILLTSTFGVSAQIGQGKNGTKAKIENAEFLQDLLNAVEENEGVIMGSLKSSFVLKLRVIHDKEIEQYRLDRNQACTDLYAEEDSVLAPLQDKKNKKYTPAKKIEMRAKIIEEYDKKEAAIKKECDDKIKEAEKRHKKEKKELDKALEDKNK